MENDYLREAQKNVDQIIAQRRDFHKHAELGFNEFKTAEKIAAYLQSLKLEVQTGVAQTGVVGLLRCGEKGRTAALRADIDALPMQEKNDIPYASVNEGVMHACGHDGHTAMLMETARLLSEKAQDLRGTVKFIFQPCEDMIPSGAEPMIQEGVLQNPDVDGIFTVHISTDHPEGTLWVKPEYISISSAGFNCTFRGQGGHVSSPHQVIDPIMMAGMLITSSQTLMLKRSAPGTPMIFAFGTIHGGTADNIVPDEVALTGSIRTATPQERQDAIEAFERVVAGIALSAGGEYSLDIEFQNPSIYNDQDMVTLLKKAGAKVMGEDKVFEYSQIRTGGDDAAYFQQKIPGVYWVLGVRNEAKGFDKPHHNPYFDFDDANLALGAAVQAQAVTDFLSEEIG